MHEGVISLSGAITQNLWPVLSPVIKLQLKQHPSGIVLDCHGIQDFTETGGETFLEAARYIQAKHGQIILAHAPASVMDALRDTPNISRLLPLAWNVAEGRERLHLPHCPESATTILVGMLGSPADAHAIALACQLLTHTDSPANARVLHLAYLVKITHETPLISADGEKETLACESLETIATHLHQQDISVSIRVERSRHPARHLLEIAQESKPEQLILALSQQASEEDTEFLEYILEHASCDVLVHRIPLAEAKKQQNKIK
jgi:nucleotide-binding universal stress UspA family protein